MGAAFARMPVAKAGCPVGVGGQELPVVERDGLGLGRRRDNALRRRLGFGRRELFGESAVEGAIDFKRRARTGLDLFWRDQRVAVVEGQPVAELGIGGAPPGFIMAGGVDGGRADLGGDGADGGGGGATAEDELAADGFERRGEAGEAVMEPPALRPADRPITRPDVVEDIEAGGRALLDGGKQRGIVGEAEVLSEPEEGGQAGHSLRRARIGGPLALGRSRARGVER